jgi:predicted nucleic acid-binding protein
MKLSVLPGGSRVFLDANVFVYAFSAEPTFGRACVDFLERIEQKEIEGVFSASLLSEVAHRLMTLEACQSFGWPYAGIARQLRRHPKDVSTLSRFRHILDEIMALDIVVLPVSAYDVIAAADLSLQHGLLSGDALIVSLMRSHSIVHLASNDADFDRIPGILRCSPT